MRNDWEYSSAQSAVRGRLPAAGGLASFASSDNALRPARRYGGPAAIDGINSIAGGRAIEEKQPRQRRGRRPWPASASYPLAAIPPPATPAKSAEERG